MPSEAVQIARDIRYDIKTLRASGKLTGLPADAKIRVRTSRSSMHTVIDIEVETADAGWGWKPDPVRGGRDLTLAARGIGEKLLAVFRIHDTGYIWCHVRLDSATLASASSDAWCPGQD